MKNIKMIKNRVHGRGNASEPAYRDVAAVLLFIFLFPYIVSFFFGSAGTELFQENMERTEFVVCNVTAAGTETMPLETYLVNRLPATINMDCEAEALKAQAVVLRTELMRRYYDRQEKGNGNEGKRNGDGGEEDKQRGKKCIYVESNMVKIDGEDYEKCKEAVDSTRGMYMSFEGVPIYAPYFAVSAGATRNGNEVFGKDSYGYLKSVVCERDFTSEDYIHTMEVGRNTFLERLQEINPGAEWEEGETLEEAFPVTRDRAGYVMEIGTGEESISGERIRAAFALNSSCFEWEQEGNLVVIKAKGLGHGLGFCQYGANEAAKKGSDFIDILNYFFSGIVIEKTE